MKHTFKILGLGAGMAVFSMISACSSGTTVKSGDAGNNEETGGATAGGASGVGGKSGAGGTTVTSSSTGGGTSTGANIIVDAFNSLAEQQKFTPNTFIPTGTDCSINVAAANDAGGAFQVDWSGGVDVNADATVTGSMKVASTFTNWDQKWAVEMNAPTDALGAPMDLTNKLVTADIKITAGLSPNSSYPFGAQLYVKTGTSFVWGASVWANVTALNTWVRLSLDTTAPDGTPPPPGPAFDPSVPRQIGIQLSTGGAGETAYCSKNYAVPFGAPVNTVAYIDQIQVEPRQ